MDNEKLHAKKIETFNEITDHLQKLSNRAKRAELTYQAASSVVEDLQKKEVRDMDLSDLQKRLETVKKFLEPVIPISNFNCWNSRYSYAVGYEAWYNWMDSNAQCVVQSLSAPLAYTLFRIMTDSAYANIRQWVDMNMAKECAQISE